MEAKNYKNLSQKQFDFRKNLNIQEKKLKILDIFVIASYCSKRKYTTNIATNIATNRATNKSLNRRFKA